MSRKTETEPKTLTKQLKVTFPTNELVEANIGLDISTRTRVTEVRVAAGDDGETLSLGLP